MALISAGFQGTFQWAIHHGYPLLFVLMLIEGPVVTAAAAFAAALNYFNIWVIVVLSLLANLIPDAIYYAIGYWGRGQFLEKYGHFVGITKERIASAEALAHGHSGKSIFAIKMIPFLATPGLIVIGSTKMDIKKYAFWCVVIAVPSSLIYLILGYYFGAAYNTIDRYLHIGTYVIIVAIVIIITVVYFQQKYSTRIAKKITKK